MSDTDTAATPASPPAADQSRSGAAAAADQPAAKIEPPPLPRWAIHRRIYDWTLAQAHHKHAPTVLFLVAMAESSFFPIPPDVLQIVLTLERRSRAWFYAAVSSVGSVVGGVLGYAIGYFLWEVVGDFFLKYVFKQELFDKVGELYQENAFLAVFSAAFTPIPYKVFTVAAGVFHVSLLMFIIGSVVGRAGRFFLVGGLLYFIGPPVKVFIEKYFNLLTVVFLVLLVGVVAAVKLL